MKNWLILLIALGCVACTDSDPGDQTASPYEDQSTPAEEAAPAMAEDTSNIEVLPDTATDTSDEAAATDLVTEEIEYSVNGEPYTGYIAYDSSVEGQRPGVLVVHEWWGHNEYARSRAQQLAKLGYTALALDMYGSGKVADHPDNAQQFMQEATANPEQVKERFLAAKQLLEEHDTTDPAQTAAIGYCFGGGVVLNMARTGVDLDGVASFHGSLAPMLETRPDEITAKVLVLHGAEDKMITDEQVQTFKQEMDAAGVDYEFISYPGAMHSFTNPDATAIGEKNDMPLAYDAEADEKSWNALKAFLESLWPES